MTPDVLLAGVLCVALVVYAITGGADFGGGVWELFASGPRARQQREAISVAVAPIWEANHVWLILAVVILFVGFPQAFAAISIALHIPITLLLMGIVLRGAAFVFRSYDVGAGAAARSQRWSAVFAIASTVSPVMLGVCAGAVASGDLTIDPATGQVQTDFLSAWLAPFPWLVGAMTLCLFAFLAATYLCVEHAGEELGEDFRRRALVSGVLLAPLALGALALSPTGAPALYEGLLASPWAISFHVFTGLLAVGALALLWRRVWRPARVLAAAQAACIVTGWGLSQFPLMIPPDLTIRAAAGPENVLEGVLWALAIGGLPLLAAFWWLFRVFKGEGAQA